MNSPVMRLCIAVCLAVALVACGENESMRPASAGETGNRAAGELREPGDRAPEEPRETAVRIAKSFVPKAGQFGVESFKIVYALKGQTTGQRTLYVEAYGDRVGIEETSRTYAEARSSQYYWDGEKGHLKDSADSDVYSSSLRMKVSEPTAFAETAASNLEMIGYARAGDKTVAGQSCEHWKNEGLNYEGCRWNKIEMEFFNGAGMTDIIQSTVAVEFVEGETIPAHLKALAD